MVRSAASRRASRTTRPDASSFETPAMRAPQDEVPVEKVKQEQWQLRHPEDRIPVIVGVGEIVDRPKEITAGLEPLTLLEQALKRAEADCGGKLLGEIGSLDIVNFLSWRYRDPEKQLAERLGIAPDARSITARSAARARSAICTRRRSASRAANAASPRSAAPRRSRPRPRPSAPASTCPGRRSRMTSRSRSAAPRSRSRWP